MACSCRNSGTVRSSGAPVAASAPHSVLPGESCIYCADKHVSTAYALALADDSVGAVIGELELARRHTALEYPKEAQAIAGTLYLASTRGKSAFLDRIGALQEEIGKAAMDAAPEAAVMKDGQLWDMPPHPHQSVNALVGELHVCAAWRLASELGYMVPNRAMIIGDLALAAEQLSRYDYDLGVRLRDMRHRVQTIRSADLDRSWAEAWERTDAIVRRNLKEFRETQAKGLRDWLGLK